MKPIYPVAFSLLLAGACGSEGKPTVDAPLSTAQPQIGGCLGTKCGPTTEDFFDNEKIGEMHITFSTDVMKEHGYEKPSQWLDLLWEKWNSHCGPYEWIPVSVQYKGGADPRKDKEILEQVAIRLRGSKSRGFNPLAGFKLDFNELLPKGVKRRFADLNRFEALSNEHDNANMLQCMSYKLMRDFGVEAPRCSHVRVFVNGELYGLVESVERGKDKRFLEHHFGNADGALYAVSASCGYTDSLGDFLYKGETFEGEYLDTYEQLNGKKGEAEQNLIPLLKCADAAQTPDDEVFKTCIQEWIEVKQWLRVIAAESLMPTVEDLVGARRNFFLYFQPDDTAPHGGVMRVWGWDYDTSLQRQACYPANCDPFTSVTAWYGPRGTRPKFITRLTSVFKTEYCELMNEFLRDVYLPEKVDAMAAVIATDMQADPVVPYEAWEADVTKMREFVANHRVEAQAQVDAACQAAPATTTP